MAYDKKHPDGYKVHSCILKQIDDIFLLGETVEIIIGESVFWIVQLPFITVYRCYHGSKT
jgi:hypothetical protein